MTKQLEQELAAWMRAQADQSGNGTDLAPGAFRKSRRIRLRRRITSVVVAAAALAVAIPAGSQILNAATGPDDGQVANTTSPDPKPTATALPKLPDAKPFDLDFSKLPRGTTTQPWWDGKLQTVRFGDYSLPLASKTTPVSFGPLRVEGSPPYAILSRYNEHSFRLDLVDQKRARPVGDALTQTFAISPDRKQVAYTTVKGVASVVSGETGKPLHSKAFNDYPSVSGFVGERVVLSAQDGDPLHVSLWDPGTDQVRTVEGAHFAYATAVNAGLVAVESEAVNANRDPCFAVVDVDDSDRQVWRSCDLQPISLSPDGRYLVGRKVEPQGGDGPAVHEVVDLRGGRTVLAFWAGWLDQVAWEPDNEHFTVEAEVDSRGAVIRCGTSGGCELVGDPVRMTSPDPYVVGAK